MSSVAFIGLQNAPKSLAAGASPLTPQGTYRATPDPLGLRGLTSKACTSKRREAEGRGGTKMIYVPGARNPRAATALNILHKFRIKT